MHEVVYSDKVQHVCSIVEVLEAGWLILLSYSWYFQSQCHVCAYAYVPSMLIITHTHTHTHINTVQFSFACL